MGSDVMGGKIRRLMVKKDACMQSARHSVPVAGNLVRRPPSRAPLSACNIQYVPASASLAPSVPFATGVDSRHLPDGVDLPVPGPVRRARGTVRRACSYLEAKYATQ